MVQLRDYSNLRQATERVEVPLNGEVYFAIPEPAAEVVLAATGMRSGAVELATELMNLNIDQRDPQAMQRLTESNPVLAMRLATAGMSTTERSIKFLQEVLEPESARRWAENMRALPPLPPGADPETWEPTDVELAAHRRRQITLPQCMAVYNALVQHYAQRPTEPSSSSSNGDGGSGGISTAGAPVVGG